MDYRVLTEAERKYTFSQSQQLSMQTGLIGYLRADFRSNGNEFWTRWASRAIIGFWESRCQNSFIFRLTANG